jgi:hypothetical protein
MSTTIRPATLFDLNELWRMWLALTSEEQANEIVQGREMYPSVVLADRNDWALDTALAITNPLVCYLIAEKGGENVGFMLSSINTRAVGHPKQFVLVHQLYVRPSERKAALGEAAEKLQQAATQWALSHRVPYIELDCVQSNRARWEKMGFTVAAHRMFKTLET